MRRKRILTIVCVLLVLGCAGWLVPAVQRVREAAARAKCKGNLKGLALAVHNYSDVNKSFAATMPDPFHRLPPERRLSWLVGILPYLEQGTAFQRFDLNRPVDEEPNVSAADARLHNITCPSSVSLDWSGNDPQPPTPVLHYVGVSGVGADAAELGQLDPRHGAFGYNRRTTISGGFPDGLGSTLLLAEAAHEAGHWAHVGRSTVRAFVPEDAPYIGPGRTFGGFHAADLKLFWSSGTMMNVAMADGSVRVVRGDIDPTVLDALATVNGRESLPAEW
jgi:prepilin-type processing-associated H-X9-DG protein